MQANLCVDDTLKAFDTDDLDDEELIRRTRNGDQEAFGLLWKRYSPKVRSIVNRFVQRSADAEDLTQDVFLKAFAALPRFRGDSQFFSWLYRIAFNTGINFTNAGSRVEWTTLMVLRRRRPIPTQNGSGLARKCNAQQIWPSMAWHQPCGRL